MTDGRRLTLAASVVKARLPGSWEVASLGAGASVFEVRRARGAKRIALTTAWNHCYRLRADPAVVFAEPSVTTVGHDPDDEQIAAAITPAEDAFTKQSRATPDTPLPCAETNPSWSIERCRTDEAWALQPPSGGAAQGKGIVVGHPDTGYTKHPEIWDSPASNLRILYRKGYDFEDDDAGAEDPLIDGFMKQPGHGTATSSVIMSTVGAAVVTGVAPKVELMPLRVTKSVVLFNFNKLAKAIYHAVDKGAHVISISLGGPYPSRALERAVAHAVANGVVVCAAAGNVWPFVVFPARLDQVIGVGACNCQDGVWKKSARGGGVDLCAPGEGVWRAQMNGTPGQPDPKTGMGYGTSFAVANVAGACALWLAYHGREALIAKYGASALVPVFRHQLLSTVRTPTGWDTRRDGAGILDTKALLAAPLPPTPPATPMQPQSAGARGLSGGGGAAEALLGFFPEDPPGAVIKATFDLLRVDSMGLQSTWNEMGDEVLFHVATNPELRGAIQQRASATDSLAPQSAPSMKRFAAEASDRLRGVIG